MAMPVAGPSQCPGADNKCAGCSHSLFRFIKRSDDYMIECLISHGVLPEFGKCGNCGSNLKLNRDKLTFRCDKMYAPSKKKKRSCAYYKSARNDTFLARTHLSVRQCLELVAVLLHLKPPRQRFIRKNVEVSSKTAVDWYSFCREVFINHAIRHSQKIGGPGCIVEIDEAKFGRSKYNRGRPVEGQWVFGGVERGTSKSFMVPVESRDRETLVAVLKEWVLPDTTVYSDCWKAYNSLNDEGFHHDTVNHSLHFVDPDTGCHTNTVERAWREVRSKIPRYGVRKAHYVGYLAEYQFKRRYPEEEERLHQFLLAAAALYPPSC